MYFLFFSKYSCFLSRIYIKPQQNVRHIHQARVVSYLVSTSNHNRRRRNTYGAWLFLISYLHQTTTCHLEVISDSRCFLSRIYIKPQQPYARWWSSACCFLSRIYIKPQLGCLHRLLCVGCFLSRIYIKPQPIPALVNYTVANLTL